MSYRPSFRKFTISRIGNPKSPWDGLRRMFSRSFGAKSFTDFWRYWNPVYHYFLSYWVYRPLRKLVPRPIAVVLSFVFCGFFFHDLILLPFTHIPIITIWFLLLGVGVIISETLHMDLSNQSQSLRITVNITYLFGLFEVARRITLGIFLI